MSYVDEGPRSDEAVLLLHGNPTWSFYYRDLIRALVRAGIRCVAPDHVGMGLSDKPQDYRLPPGRAYRESGRTGRRAWGCGACIWSCTTGAGRSASAGPVRQPEKVGRIVILNTAAFPSPGFRCGSACAGRRCSASALVRGLNGFAGPATRMAMHRQALTAEVKRGYLFPYDSWANRIGVARFVADIPMRPDIPAWRRWRRWRGGWGASGNIQS